MVLEQIPMTHFFITKLLLFHYTIPTSITMVEIKYQNYIDKQVALPQRFTTQFTPIKLCVDTVHGTSNLFAKCTSLCMCPLHLPTSILVQENFSAPVM